VFGECTAVLRRTTFNMSMKKSEFESMIDLDIVVLDDLNIRRDRMWIDGSQLKKEEVDELFGRAAKTKDVNTVRECELKYMEGLLA
jgi:hypothetical protein